MRRISASATTTAGVVHHRAGNRRRSQSSPYATVANAKKAMNTLIRFHERSSRIPKPKTRIENPLIVAMQDPRDGEHAHAQHRFGGRRHRTRPRHLVVGRFRWRSAPVAANRDEQHDEEPGEAERADDAELLAALAAGRRVLRALRLHVGERLDAVLLDRQHQLGDLEPFELGLRRVAPHHRGVLSVQRHVHERGREVDRRDGPDRDDRDRGRREHAPCGGGR